jgi:cation transport regulator ChaC
LRNSAVEVRALDDEGIVEGVVYRVRPKGLNEKAISSNLNELDGK